MTAKSRWGGSIKCLFLGLTTVCVFFFLFLIPQASAAITPGSPDNFITTWDATSENFIFFMGIGAGYNYDVYWENVASSSINGTITGRTNPFLTLVFPINGVYRVEIAGDYPRIYFGGGGDREKILEVNQWGNIQWSSMERAFQGTSNLRITATDAPNLSNVTDMSSMFIDASSLNDPLGHWDVSNVTSMLQMFEGASSFNQSLNDWDISSVISVGFMFNGATNFSQPLNNWDTSKVVHMGGMFNNATAFNQSLASWDISSSTNMSGVLANTRLSTANQDATLASWATQATAGSLTGRQLHIGLKSYSSIGADAIGILQGLGWTITEQYSATYNVPSPATLTGNAFQVRSSGQSTTPVTVNVPPQCSFLGWSDGNASTTRSDVLVDNLSVSANVDCTPKSSGQFVIKQSIYNEIALSIGSSLVLSPSIPGVTGGVSSGELPFNIKTNNPLGYQVDLKFSEAVPFRHLFSPSFYILNYVPVATGVPDYNLVTPTKSHGFAYSVYSDNATQLFRHSGSTCGVGSDNTLGKCWFNRVDASVPTTIIERSGATGAEGATSTLQFRVLVDQNPMPMLPNGEYQATVTVTVLPL